MAACQLQKSAASAPGRYVDFQSWAESEFLGHLAGSELELRIAYDPLRSNVRAREMSLEKSCVTISARLLNVSAIMINIFRSNRSFARWEQTRLAIEIGPAPPRANVPRTISCANRAHRYRL